MTEDEARDWLRATFGASAFTRLERFEKLLLRAAAQQSLIARSTFHAVWSRHLADSAQLVPLAPANGVWLDVGSGGGLPGIVVAILRDAPLLMVEPRRKRVDFLQQAVEDLQLSNAKVVHGHVQSLRDPFDVVSARAVASMDALFTWTRGLVSRETLFLLPRGENAVRDLAITERAWHGTFHVKQSLTDSAAGIVIARDVRPR